MEVRLSARHPVSAAPRAAGSLRQAPRQARLASRGRSSRVGRLKKMLATFDPPTAPKVPKPLRHKRDFRAGFFSLDAQKGARKETVVTWAFGRLGRFGRGLSR